MSKLMLRKIFQEVLRKFSKGMSRVKGILKKDSRRISRKITKGA